MMRFPNTVCIWTGRSIHPQGDGGEIAVFLSGIRNPSGNRKTGPMLQTYILSNSGTNPVSVANDPRGAWRDACGGCALAHAIGGACYVNLGQAPLSIWQAWNRGSVPHLIPSQSAALLETIAGQSIRLGSYGDPAAVPLETWKWLLRGAPAWTGYSHAWRALPKAHPLSRYCMASVDRPEDIGEAVSRGWRAYSLAPDPETVDGAIPCPHYSRGISCADCTLCSGSAIGAKSIAVRPHGPKAARVFN